MLRYQVVTELTLAHHRIGTASVRAGTVGGSLHILLDC
jgi:hypothetical protein